jgi:arylsulfatase A-like enzyme
VRNLDLAPTLLELAGIAVPESFQGRSLVPLMRNAGEAAAADRPAYASLPAQLYRDAVLQESLSTGRWSLVRNLDESRRESLFDLAVDPDEQVDLIEIEPEAALRLRPLLDAYQDRTPAPGAVRSDIRIDPHIAEKLRALGYLH